jgi:hypothetical protein
MKMPHAVFWLLRSLMARKRALIGFSFGPLAFCACDIGGSEKSASSTTTTDITSHFLHAKSVELQEAPASLIVEPLLHLAEDTSVLLADPKAVRIAHFRSSGALAWAYSKRGDSAGLLRMPISLAKTKDGYWVADAMNGLMLFDSASIHFVRALPLPEVSLHDMIAYDDTTLIVAGPSETRAAAKVSWLRALDSRSGVERWRAVSPIVQHSSKVINSYSRVRISTHHGIIAATSSVLDTIFLIDGRSGLLLKAHSMNLALRIPRVLSKAKTRVSAAELRDLTRVSIAVMLDQNHYMADIATGAGQQIRLARSIGDLRTAPPGQSFATTQVILGARDGVLVAQSVDANQRNHVKLLWGIR